MPAPKGHPRYGGRGKGTPNKNKQALLDKCLELGLDPFEAMVKIAQDLGSEPTMRFNALKEICQYVYAKKKAIEHSARFDSRVLEEAEALLDLPDAELAKLALDAAKKLK